MLLFCCGNKRRRDKIRKEKIYYISVMILKALSLIYGYLKNFNSGKVEIVTKEAKEERLLFCRSCIHNKNGSCKLCGCVISSKVLFSNEKCPDKRWS